MRYSKPTHDACIFIPLAKPAHIEQCMLHCVAVPLDLPPARAFFALQCRISENNVPASLLDYSALAVHAFLLPDMALLSCKLAVCSVLQHHRAASSVCLSACLPASLSACQPVCLPVCLSVCLSVCLCLSVSVGPSVCVCLPVCLSVVMTVFLSACLSVCPSLD